MDQENEKTKMKIISLTVLTLLGASRCVCTQNLCTNGTYDKYERPYAGHGPLNVTTRLLIRNINDIDEKKFTFNLDLIIYHWYHDHRLAANCSTPEFLKTLRRIDDIWFPKLGLINCHDTEDVPNSEKVTIEDNGNVFAHKRITTECYCIMDLTAFPMDTQYCPIKLESYVYSKDEIHLRWQETPVEFEEGMEIIGYKHRELPVAKKTIMIYSYGDWEVMELVFAFERQALHFIYRAYIPIILLMIFNFVSYWIPHTAIPARVTLIITTFLTLMLILQSVSAQTAKATSTTSLQIFLMFSVILVVVAIVEFLIVLYVDSLEKVKITHIDVTPSLTEQNNNSTRRRHRKSTSDVIPLSPRGEKFIGGGETKLTRVKQYNAAVIDKVFRYLAPLTFALFCIIYFAYFMNYDSNNPHQHHAH